jgi:hypothetical protein
MERNLRTCSITATPLRQSRRLFKMDKQQAIRVKTGIASQRVGAKRRPMTSSAKRSRMQGKAWIASSLHSSQ